MNDSSRLGSLGIDDLLVQRALRGARLERDAGLQSGQRQIDYVRREVVGVFAGRQTVGQA